MMIEEAPVFYPSIADFNRGPINYIAKIRSQAEKYGICKIVPPKSFKPPFAVNVDCFKFTPRLQRLNELEASVRTKLNFIDTLFKFWELQACIVKVPYIEGRLLDLHQLYDCVKAEGGFEACVYERRWAKVTQRMGYITNSHNRGTVASLLRHHYEKILYPYDIFLSGATICESYSPVNNSKTNNNNDNKTSVDSNSSPTTETTNSSIQTPAAAPAINTSNSNSNTTTPHKQKTNNQISTQSLNNNRTLESNNINNNNNGPSSCNSRNSRLSNASSPALSDSSSISTSSSNSKELLKLRTYGAGPKMPGVIDDPNNQTSNNRLSNNGNNSNNSNSRINNSRYDCVQCHSVKPSHLLVTCDNCHHKFHITCLFPPLKDMPKSGAWNCHTCLAMIVNKRPKHYAEFGFIPSQNQYTLAEFERMANQFKSKYFEKECHEVPLSDVEEKYWHLVSSLEDTVCVEYGADLHCNEFGSGFPTQTTKDLLDLKSNEYIDHPWNLNNMPVADGSVFKYINTNISGMIIPWMYVGMCFSTFCWHNEDHWTYSINYLHYGDAKTWYGVPGAEAEAFEASMKRIAPDLFESQPDLLHQLVTICDPKKLTKDKVPVYRVNQYAGEFVVTFPRAYHTGFNQGLNFAEAVNFAPADWLKLGRNCIDHYSSLRRFPVFSQDELICKMASDPSTLDYTTSLATLEDLGTMLKQELTLRSEALDWGVTNSQRHMFENYPDDERQCRVCKTTCFLSALSCQCDSSNEANSTPSKMTTDGSMDENDADGDNNASDSTQVSLRLVCLSHKDKLCDSCEPKKHILKFRYNLNELPVLERRLRKHIMLLESGRNQYSQSGSGDSATDVDIDSGGDSLLQSANNDCLQQQQQPSITSTGAVKHSKTSHHQQVNSNNHHQQNQLSKLIT